MADSKNQRAEDHHYVPKSILRNFTRGHKEKVCVFDKQSGKEFETNLRNILAERRFNDVFVGDRYVSLEPAVTELEGTLLGPLRRVVEVRNLADLTPEERGFLPLLLAFQHLRAKQFRDRTLAMSEQLERTVLETEDELGALGGLLLKDPEEIKKFSLGFMGRFLTELMEVISTRRLFLIGTTPDKPFYLGDSPVVMHNQRRSEFFGNIGFGVEGIEIYMPLSSTLTLAAVCPSLIESARLTLTRGTMTGTLSTAQRSQLTSLLAAADKGTLDLVPPGHVDFLNGLQVHWAGRFVICPKGDFEFARRVVWDQAVRPA